MAFTVGWPGASSPVGVPDADAHHSDRGNATWTGSAEAKQAALTRATDYVRTLFARRFDPLLFPVVDELVVIPDALTKAVAEYALIELVTPGGLAPAPAVDVSGYSVVKTKKKVGPIESTFAVVGGDGARVKTRRVFPVPDALIASLMLPSLGNNRVIR